MTAVTAGTEPGTRGGTVIAREEHYLIAEADLKRARELLALALDRLVRKEAAVEQIEQALALLDRPRPFAARVVTVPFGQPAELVPAQPTWIFPVRPVDSPDAHEYVSLADLAGVDPA